MIFVIYYDTYSYPCFFSFMKWLFSTILLCFNMDIITKNNFHKDEKKKIESFMTFQRT